MICIGLTDTTRAASMRIQFALTSNWIQATLKSNHTRTTLIGLPGIDHTMCQSDTVM